MKAADPAPPADKTKPSASRLDPRVRGELLNFVYSDQPLSLASGWLFALAIAEVLAHVQPSADPWIWLSGITLTFLGRLCAAWWFWRTPVEKRNHRTWEIRFFLGATLTALFWGAIGWYAYPIASPTVRGAVVLLIGGVIAAASRTVACQIAAFCAYATIAGLPLVVWLFVDESPSSMLIGGFAIVYVLLMLALGRSFRNTVAESFRLQFENGDLAAQLRKDIAAREAAEIALRASEERLRFAHYALDRAQDFVALIDPNGSLLQVNESVCRYTSRTAAELATLKIWDGIIAMDRKEFESRWQAVKENGAVTFETEILDRNRVHKPVEVIASYIQFNDREAVCAIARDLTSRRAAEEERMHLQHQLQETQRLESLGVLAGGIAHDFNNLLTAILGNASLARESLDDLQATSEMLSQIEIAGNQAAGLCRQMLAYAGRGQLTTEPLDISAIVADTAKLLDTTVGRRAHLELNLAPNLPTVTADASQLRQIVINLVHNSAEAMGRSDGRIVVATYPIHINKKLISTARIRANISEGDGVALTVADNGGGMNAETLGRIFEPFFTTKFTGRGLGLPAVLGIVRSHRALLHVASKVGYGSTFRVVFPASKDAPRTAPPATTGRILRQQGRVLVIDDEEPVRFFAGQVLERLGFEVELAADGNAAIAALGSNPNRFRFLLVDMTMPGKDGITTLRELRDRGVTAPAIIMSGYSERQVRQQMDSEVAQEFLQKPFNSPALRAKIETILNVGH